jgi:predicted 2-oxoglutarate/Fe(II)-dependent dioxygenase YbiX
MNFSHKTISNFLTKEECKEILNFSLENLNLNPAEIDNDYDKNTNTNVRKSNVAFYSYYKKFPFLLENMTELLNNNIDVKGFDLNYENSEFQFTEYNFGDFFNWHKDNNGNTITEFDRYCSIVIQLNDEYENGDLQIETTNNEILTIEKSIGTLFIFLSDTQHRVTTITDGNRYTLVNWVGLKKQNNYKKTLL